MKLSNADKNILRDKIEDELEKVDNNQKVKLDKELLEFLMFDQTKTLFTEMPAKFIVWSGDFLKKLDLSEISFDDVVWHGSSMDFWNEFPSLNVDKKRYVKNRIDLSGTNAQIDFANSFEMRNGMEMQVENCDFEDVDLSKSNTELITIANNCDFSYTDALIGHTNHQISFTNCNLEGIDLSHLELGSDCLNSQWSTNIDFSGSNLADTGIKINHNFKLKQELEPKIDNFLELLKETNDMDEIENLFNSNLYKEVSSYVEFEEHGKYLKYLIQEGLLDGCYVNGKYIRSHQEATEEAYRVILEYKKYRENVLGSALEYIDQEMNKQKKVLKLIK